MTATATIGHNSQLPGDTPAEIERKRKVQQITRELNALRSERSAIGDEEKDIKSELKELGLSPKVVGIAKRAGLSKKQSPEEILDLAQKVINGELGVEQMGRLREVALSRRTLSARERDVKADAAAHGINIRALTLARQLQEMDQIEREEVFDALVDYAQTLKIW